MLHDRENVFPQAVNKTDVRRQNRVKSMDKNEEREVYTGINFLFSITAALV